MFTISISIHTEQIPADQTEVLLQKHREWFAKYFGEGNFLIIGPYVDQSHSGLILAQAESREALDAILSQDVYYPQLASYEVREFSPKFIAENIADYKE